MCRPLSRGTHFSKTDTRGPGNSICADPCREVHTSPKRTRGVPGIPYVPTPVERYTLLQNGHAGSREFHMCRPLSRDANFSKTGTRGPGNSICADPCREVQTSPKRARGVPAIPYVPVVGGLVGWRGDAKTKNLNLGDVAEKGNILCITII